MTIKKDIDKIQNTRIGGMKNDIYPAMTFIKQDWREKLKHLQLQKGCFKYISGLLFPNEIETLIDFIQQTIDHSVSEAVENVIELIAHDQGWEESGDIYRKYFGLPIKYPKK